jgi:enamine deaminase RidA (YjgF/YER057c/UK114 family)
VTAGRRAAAKLEVTSVPPVTLVGVATLAEPDLLVEIEGTAVLN